MQADTGQGATPLSASLRLAGRADAEPGRRPVHLEEIKDGSAQLLVVTHQEVKQLRLQGRAMMG